MADLWTIERLLAWTQDYFQAKGIDTPRLDAEVLLAHSLGKDRIYLYTHFDKPLAEAERATFRAFVRRRAAREPVAYIVGAREFFSRAFSVTPAVLIPRPETEHLVEQALAWCEAHEVISPRILDVGTGSGALAVTLACELPQATVVAVDLSAEAIAVATANAQAHHVADRCRFLVGDLLAPVAQETFNVIVSNPPYVPEVERPHLAPEVTEFEPSSALFAGSEGLDILRRLVPPLADHLMRPSLFACELDPSQCATVVAWLQQRQEFDEVQVVGDLQGLDRVVLALQHAG